MNIRFDISPELLDTAEMQIFGILSKQRTSFDDRWFNRPIIVKLKRIFRALGLVLSLLGMAICMVALVLEDAWKPTRLGPGMYFLILPIFALFFYFLPSIDKWAVNRVRQISIRGSKKLAAKCVKAGRNMAPYTAEYDIKGGSVSYYREKDGEVNFAWTRKLKGVAVQSKFVTIIFRKWTSFVPMIVLLHEDSESVAEALHTQNIGCRLYDNRLTEEPRSSSASA